ncbi:MAG: LCP family protein [Chloroflexi bacterium]|nr:LCP family protein [Chloroflexota bacterium]
MPAGSDRLDPPGLPRASAGSSLPLPPKPRLDRQERVNILLTGIDRRPGETGGTLTDAIIVVTVDPATKSVGMLSIPRDLWVTIPGFSENRINTAYWTGTRARYPGGGFALLKRTIQQNLGIPIHYYVRIDFVGFKKVVDTLGGITVDVPRDLYDPTFPDDRYGYRPLVVRKGVQRMNGQQALDYARTRHVDNDFGRMKRQQQVIMAIKDQALRLDAIPKIPALWAAKADMVETDLGLNEVLAFAQMARDIKSDNIRSGVIGDAETTDWTTPGGAMVLLPNRERVRKVIETVFKTPMAALTQDEPGDQFRRLAAEGARIEVSNGTATEGLAGRAAEWLKAQGFSVVLVDNASRSDMTQTQIVEAASKPYTRGLLLRIMRLNTDRARSGDVGSGVDMRIVLGQDFDTSMLPSSQ